MLQLPTQQRATRRGVLVLFVTLGVLLGRTACHAEEIKIETADHKTIQGQSSGNGASALLLCHGRSAKNGAESFKELSETFSRKGIRCLAISFRGYPSENPEDLPHKEFDVVAGFDLLVSKGAMHVFVLGSSMGGFAALEAMEALQTRKE